MKILMTILLGAALLAQNAEAKKKPANQEQVDQTVAMIEKVNDYWQSTRSTECRAFWDNAAYYTGNMAAYDLTKKQEYLDYSIKWAEHNKWMGANNPDPAKWRYKTYGEGQDFVLFAALLLPIVGSSGRQ